MSTSWEPLPSIYRSKQEFLASLPPWRRLLQKLNWHPTIDKGVQQYAIEREGLSGLIPPPSTASSSTKPQGHRPAKTSRIELRATEDDSDLLDRAAAGLGTDRSSFLLAQGRLAAQRVLADRELINGRPARSLPGLARLLERPSPFA